MFAAGILVFGLAAVGTGLAGRLELLLVARGVQGLGAAMVFATSLALVAEVVPSARRGLAIELSRRRRRRRQHPSLMQAVLFGMDKEVTSR